MHIALQGDLVGAGSAIDQERILTITNQMGNLEKFLSSFIKELTEVKR